MAEAPLTLANVRTVVKEEIVLERDNVRRMVHEAIVEERVHARDMIREAIVEERVHTRQMIQEAIVEERGYTRQMMQEVVQAAIQSAVTEINKSIKRVQTMLEEDARAESDRLSRVDRRSARTARRLAKHMADPRVHLGAA